MFVGVVRDSNRETGDATSLGKPPEQSNTAQAVTKAWQRS